jgi:DNA-binding transcriptional LysR family regulator
VNLASVDLNRLLVLHTVLTERSVSRAAAVLHVTPSAVSNALARLRDTFGDPLLVRNGRSLVLTPRAAALAPQLATAVAAMARVVEDQASFDPGRSTRTFTVGCSDAEQISEVPQIAAVFARKLPNASLRVISVEQLEARGGLASTDVDAVIGPAPNVSREIHASDLYEDEGVLVVRKGHSHARRRMSVAQFNALRHIDILAIAVPSFAAAAAIASRTDWVAGMPRRMADVFLRQMPLMRVAMPVPALRFRIQLWWHERTHTDPGARFFRSLIADAVQKRS